MMDHEVLPRHWGNDQIITSPVNGSVESIKVESGERVREQQSLVIIRIEQGNAEQIMTGTSGIIDALNVKVGDKVVRGDVLLFIKEDL